MSWGRERRGGLLGFIRPDSLDAVIHDGDNPPTSMSTTGSGSYTLVFKSGAVVRTVLCKSWAEYLIQAIRPKDHRS